MSDAIRLFVALLEFRDDSSSAVRRHLIRATHEDAAREHALAIGRAEEGAASAPGSPTGSWTFAGIRELSEIEAWDGEGELASNPFLEIRDTDD